VFRRCTDRSRPCICFGRRTRIGTRMEVAFWGSSCYAKQKAGSMEQDGTGRWGAHGAGDSMDMDMDPCTQRSQGVNSGAHGGWWTDEQQYNDMINRMFSLWSVGESFQLTRASGKATSEEHQVDVQPDLHGPVKVATGQGFIRARPEDVLNMVVAIERRPDWDDLCDYASQVKKLGEQSDIVYLSYQGKLGVCARDLCLLRAWQGRPDGSTVLVSHSIECDDVPRVAGKVRAECQDCVYVVTPAEDGCIFSYVIQLDMKGYVPLFFSNLIQTQHPLIIIMLRRYLEAEGRRSQSAVGQ